MAHQLQLEKAKYRQWAKAGLGLGYLKEGLAPFCHDIANQQHKDILDNIQQKKSPLLPVTCGTCQIKTLTPDHVKAGNKVCPYGQTYCNCWFPDGKIPCPNNICGVIYDGIIQSHASTPPAPNWKNTDAQMWTADPWSIAKCFINASGYDQKTSAADTDCTGLLHVIINNKYFHNHIACNLTGQSIFSKVRKYRNEIFHSSSMELEETEANLYIDDMISIIQDGKELINKPYAQDAVKRLQALKAKDFIITTQGMEDILRQIKEEMEKVLKSTENLATKEEYEDLKTKLADGNDKTEEEHLNLKKKLTELETLMSEEKAGKLEAEKEHAELKKKLTELETLMSQEKAGKLEAEKEHAELEKKLTELESLMSQEKAGKLEAEKEHAELKKKLTELETLMSKEKAGKLEAEKEHAELKKKLTELETLMSKERAGKLEAEKEYLELKQNFNKLEALVSEQKVEMEKIKEDKSQQKQIDYEQTKSEWRNKMIQEYLENCLKVPAMPLQPDKECDFSKVYVRPKIVGEVKNEKGKTEEEIKSMSEIFTRKLVYVVGDAGSGKSSFCKYLVNCWCMAHSEEQMVKDEFNSINEMKKFDFLFLISLRHNQNIDSIHEMLKIQYHIDILDTLLEKESAKMIILLDGLDEWSSECKTSNQFQTVGLPKRDVYKDYTILTTSRPWKIHTLGVRDKEIQQMLKLRGFDDDSERVMITRTVSNINRTVSNITSRKDESKDINFCINMLQEKSLRSLKQVPIMLQQLICLWFDGHLYKSSRCDVYTEMLELFFTWNDDKTVGTHYRKIEGSQNMELPESFADKEMCKLNSHLIYNMAQLAYETLFNCPKDKSLTFDISVFIKLKISGEIREDCLKLGLLTNDRCPSFFVSKRPKSMFSFIHKSVQEFLAAVNIAIKFITKMSSLKSLEDTDLQRESIEYIKKVFMKCSTVNEILEQSNVIIMLCNLEPRLATHVLRYIYDIVEGDPLVQRYRRTIDSDSSYSSYSKCVYDVQTLISDSMDNDNCNTCLVGDLYEYEIWYMGICMGMKIWDNDCSRLNWQKITPDSVHSVNVKNINTGNDYLSKALLKFKHLEKISLTYDRDEIIQELLFERMMITKVNKSVDEPIKINASKYEVNKYVAETIKQNASTLKSLSLSDYNERYSSGFELSSLYKEVVCILPSMTNLVAIRMTDIGDMSHDDTSRFCEFLEGTSQLEQIHTDFRCKCWNQHDVDLSKHQQLQYLYLSGYTFICVISIGNVNLEIFKCMQIYSTNYKKTFDSIGKCVELKKLVLSLDRFGTNQSSYTSITKRLVSVLPLLHNLSELRLEGFRLTDNIIKVPQEMKSLNSIYFSDVTMSLTTWRKFVDSLPSIPHTVDVGLFDCYITRDGEELKNDRLSLRVEKIRGENENEAIQYVKDSKHLSIVNYDYSLSFRFSTKK